MIRSKRVVRNATLWLGALLLAVSGAAQTVAWQDPEQAIAFQTGPDTGLRVVATDLSQTQIFARGPAAVIDLRCRLTLENRGVKPVRGVTLSIESEQPGAGGKASVAAPSLHAVPGESFSVDVNLRLLRPAPTAAGPLAAVSVDGVLHADMSFAGPNRLESRRKLTLLETEARRDRERLRAALASSGQDGLRQAALAILERQAQRPNLQARLAGGGRAVTRAAANAGTTVQLALLDLEGSPLELLSGEATVSDSSATSPRISLRNRSAKSVRYYQLGWVVADREGTRYSAGVLPSSGPALAPGASGRLEPGRSFELAGGSGEPFSIGGMSGYVRQAEFADGAVWTPSIAALEAAGLRDVEVSAEEQRLAEIYRRKGVEALAAELERF